MGELSQQEQQYQLQLARAGEFTLEDVEANRAGRWSERQVNEANRGCLILSVIGFVIALLLIITGVLIIFDLISQEKNEGASWALIITGLAIAGVCAFLLKRHRAASWKDVQISFIEGLPIRSKTGKVKAAVGGLRLFTIALKTVPRFRFPRSCTRCSERANLCAYITTTEC